MYRAHSTHNTDGKKMQILIWKFEGKRGFEKSNHKIYLKKIVYRNIDWIQSGSEWGQTTSYKQDIIFRIQLHKLIC